MFKVNSESSLCKLLERIKLKRNRQIRDRYYLVARTSRVKNLFFSLKIIKRPVTDIMDKIDFVFGKVLDYQRLLFVWFSEELIL